ncbi:FAD-dependent oxidoreductase [Ferrimonas pelagia]|uniref:FAD-dependent oxidoreductase n=2 Tax=Ferrimonas pelagia TaxID=1177826 RepID=A0ABP9FIQ7_9GAMM
MPTIGIVGAGVAGVTIAQRLARSGQCQLVLLDKSDSMVNGPPICHLHAGGNLYRDLPEQECLALLEQSIATLRFYPHCANIRPTVIAVPKEDPGSVATLLPRLRTLQQRYAELVQQDPANRVLGCPQSYFKVYRREDIEALQGRSYAAQPEALDDWMIPVAQHLDLDRVQWPLILVQEYGLSVFRLAANATLALQRAKHCRLMLSTQVTQIREQGGGWRLGYEQPGGGRGSVQVDYLINACGYRSGTLDDLAGLRRERMVEFKAAYVTRWQEQTAHWPELIFHGQRGTPQGMAQFTPYADGYVQLHGMTDEITLFDQGLASSCDTSAQPRLAGDLQRKLEQGWSDAMIEQRTNRAIQHIARFLPGFALAEIGGKPLFGAQQIPGVDPELRAADVSFVGHNYARSEIVKASSALAVADAIEQQLNRLGWLPPEATAGEALSENDPLAVESLACTLAQERDYPSALAKQTGLAEPRIYGL